MTTDATDFDLDRLRGLEAILFLADEPLGLDLLAVSLECDEAHVEHLLGELAQRLDERQSGLTLRQAAGGWRLYTAPEARDHVERHVLSGRSGRLSQAALETLAVIAYKQPISRTEIGDIRAVNADGAVRSLVARGMIAEVGRDDGPGQAVLYGTTTEFLEKVGLDSIDDLPDLTGFLPEEPAPDEPMPDQIKRARALLASGRELPSTGAARWDPEDVDVEITSDEDGGEEVDAREEQLRARREDAERRRTQEAEMDELTGALERVAQSAMSQLRQAIDAEGSDDSEDDAEPDVVIDVEDEATTAPADAPDATTAEESPDE